MGKLSVVLALLGKVSELGARLAIVRYLAELGSKLYGGRGLPWPRIVFASALLLP